MATNLASQRSDDAYEAVGHEPIGHTRTGVLLYVCQSPQECANVPVERVNVISNNPQTGLTEVVRTGVVCCASWLLAGMSTHLIALPDNRGC